MLVYRQSVGGTSRRVTLSDIRWVGSNIGRTSYNGERIAENIRLLTDFINQHPYLEAHYEMTRYGTSGIVIRNQLLRAL